MSDPEPLRTNARPLEAYLLDAARDDAPPPELLGRTLVKVGVAGAGAAAASAASTTASAAGAGGGLLSAIGIGTLAGLLAVGVLHQVLPPAEPAPGAQMVESSVRPIVPGTAERAGVPPAPTAMEAVPGSSSPAATLSRPASPPARVRTGASALAAELALIDGARSALASGDRARALVILDRYAREFPSGQLAPEAAAVRAEAAAGPGDAGASIP